jgi:hypothetical protein
MTEVLPIGGLEFEIRRSDRRKTFGLTVDRGGELIAHVPSATSAEDLSRWIQRKLLWVHQKLLLKEELAARQNAPEYISGEGFCYLGRRYRLKLVSQQEKALAFNGSGFTLKRGTANPESCFREWYIQTGLKWLEKRVSMMSSRSGAQPRKVEVRDLGYRWGSCGKHEAIYFNWKLLQVPARLVDYVIMHELVHLRVPHHGAAFWRALDLALPDWKDRKEVLDSRAGDYLVFGIEN